jgi:hypothetical protein
VNDDLKRHLTPDDDGRAFVDAVLLRASGALYRRRQNATAGVPAWEWLARWARPWLVALLLLVAFVSLLPRGGAPAPQDQMAAETEARAEALVTAAQPEDVFAQTGGR